MTPDQYIEHEIQIRLQRELTDERFKMLESMMREINTKFNWLLTFLMGSVIIPMVLHHYGLI